MADLHPSGLRVLLAVAEARLVHRRRRGPGHPVRRVASGGEPRSGGRSAVVRAAPQRRSPDRGRPPAVTAGPTDHGATRPAASPMPRPRRPKRTPRRSRSRPRRRPALVAPTPRNCASRYEESALASCGPSGPARSTSPSSPRARPIARSTPSRGPRRRPSWKLDLVVAVGPGRVRRPAGGGGRRARAGQVWVASMGEGGDSLLGVLAWPKRADVRYVVELADQAPAGRDGAMHHDRLHLDGRGAAERSERCPSAASRAETRRLSLVRLPGPWSRRLQP